MKNLYPDDGNNNDRKYGKSERFYCPPDVHVFAAHEAIRSHDDRLAE